MPHDRHPPVLKVFSGPHAGAEIVLVESEYVIGRVDDCDIVLTDESLAERHVRLTLRDGGVLVESLGDTPAYVEGQPITSRELEPFQYLTLGDTHLVIGPNNEDWPKRPVPVIQAVSEQDTGDTEPEADPDDGESEPETASDADSAPTKEPLNEAPSRRKMTAKTRWIVVTALLCLLGGGGLVVLYSSASAAGSQAARPAVDRDELQRIVGEIAPVSSVEIIDEDDRLAAQGHVIEKATARKLEQALHDAAPTLDTSNIWDTETIARAVRGFLKMRRLNELEVEIGSLPGQVTVSGVLETLDDWQKAKSDIRSKTRVDTLVDQVMTQERAVEIAKEQEAEQAQATTPTETAPSPPPSSNESFDGLPFQISSVIVGRTKSFRVNSGVKVMEHGTIDDYYVKSINSERIALVKDGRDVIVKLDGP